MASKYHNLTGWMRDVRQVLRSGDQLAYELAELLIDVDELVDEGTPSAVDAADDYADDTADDNQAGVDGEEPAERKGSAAGRGGHDAGSAYERSPTGRLERQLGLLPGVLRDTPESVLAALRNRPMGESERVTVPFCKQEARRGTKPTKQ